MDHTAHTTVEGPALTRLAVSATLHCLTGCAIGEVLGMVIGTALGWGDLQTVALAVLLACDVLALGLRRPALVALPVLVTLSVPVSILTGALASVSATISSIDEETGKLEALVSIFGRETPVELTADQVEKVM